MQPPAELRSDCVKESSILPKQPPMPDHVAILALGTAVPAHCVQQSDFAHWLATAFPDQPATARWLRSLFAHAGVETRYSCLADYAQPPTSSRFFPGQPCELSPTTAERMVIYEREAPLLGRAAADQALAEFATTTGTTLAEAKASITHLVAVSCTGFFAPGLDLALARELELSSTLGRTLIGFMGCSAAFNGLRTAAQIVHGQPGARVLVVCVELSSLHVQPHLDREQLIAASLFADGAAAAVVGSAAAEQPGLFFLEEFHTTVKPHTRDQMVWQIGNHGFTLHLSPQIPQHLAEVAPAAVQQLTPDASPRFWAIHPGGPAILDQLAAVLALAPEQLAVSRAVLRQFGNLSSGTILFVLAELRRHLAAQLQSDVPHSGLAMAFGPGLTLEMARLRYQA